MAKNEMQVFANQEFGHLEVLMIDDKPFFPATECAKVLGYSNPQEAIRTHCKGVRKTLTPSNGGNQAKNFITEGDLYRLIVRSKLVAAERFEKWVLCC
jgi:prophage antirepressor-like protein